MNTKRTTMPICFVLVGALSITSCQPTRLEELKANEELSLTEVKSANIALKLYAITYGNSFPVSFSWLGPGRELSNREVREGVKVPTDKEHAGPLTAFEASCKGFGYAYRYEAGTPDKHGKIKSFKFLARPTEYGKTGRRSLFTDQSERIGFTLEDRDAMPNDNFIYEQ